MQNSVQYIDGEEVYMEQDDEWEREGLLDPAWEKQQKKVDFMILNPFYLPCFSISAYTGMSRILINVHC